MDDGARFGVRRFSSVPLGGESTPATRVLSCSASSGDDSTGVLRMAAAIRRPRRLFRARRAPARSVDPLPATRVVRRLRGPPVVATHASGLVRDLPSSPPATAREQQLPPLRQPDPRALARGLALSGLRPTASGVRRADRGLDLPPADRRSGAAPQIRSPRVPGGRSRGRSRGGDRRWQGRLRLRDAGASPLAAPARTRLRPSGVDRGRRWPGAASCPIARRSSACDRHRPRPRARPSSGEPT